MKPRIIGYEIYTGETPKGQPLFKLVQLCDLGDRHSTVVIIESENRDEVEDKMRVLKRRLR